ncbi:hypothetical protein LL035_05625 [Lactobacillus delbrueckii subsp. lactis]|nr:hypothetical protein LL035_05625 [Lactobacillus delbrueckii subsp. lactis]GEA69890.1 hypothetical protein LDE02_00270 [Lactobacillus delbrueckii subsp. lactis]
MFKREGTFLSNYLLFRPKSGKIGRKKSWLDERSKTTWQKDGFTIRLAKASDVDDYYFQNYCPLDRKCPD